MKTLEEQSLELIQEIDKKLESNFLTLNPDLGMSALKEFMCLVTKISATACLIRYREDQKLKESK